MYYNLLAVIGSIVFTVLMMKWCAKSEKKEEETISEEHKRLLANIESSKTFQDIHNCEVLFDRFTYSIAHRKDYSEIFRNIENAIESRRASIRAVQNVFNELRVTLN